MITGEATRKSLFGQQGFTLLELLISITLLAVIVLITSGVMRLGFRSAESGRSKIESLDRFRTSLNIIESQIQSAFLLKKTAGTSVDEDFAQFKGDRKSLQLRSLYSLWGGTKGPVLASYRIADEMGGRKTIYVSESPIAISDVTKETKLIDNAKDIFFEYYYKGPTDEKGKWVEEWTDKETLPDKIRLTIDRDSKVLALIIPLKIASKAGQVTSAEGPEE